MKFKTKMILIFSTLITAAFALLMSIGYLTIIRSNEQLVSTMSSQLFEAKAREASDWLAQRVSELEVIAHSPEVRSMDEQQIRPYVEELNQDIGQHFGNPWGTFAIGGTDGIGWVSDSKTINVFSRNYFQQAMASDKAFILSNPVTSKTDQSPIVLICYPLRNNGVPYGFINAAIELHRLTEVTRSIEFYDGVSWITDSQGNNYTILPSELEETERQLLKKTLMNEPPDKTRSIKSGSSQLYITPIPLTGDWYLCTRVSRSLLMKDTYTLLSSLIAVWALLLILTVLTVMLMSRTISRPLVSLSETMEKAENDLTIRAEEKGNDEIGQLSRAFNHLTAELQQMINRTVESEKEKRNAELKTLQAQINPHFLYNTLDLLHWMAYDHHDKDMQQLIEMLSGFYRISLSKGDEFIPIHRELDHVRYYCEIQKMRFDDHFDYTLDIDDDIKNLIMLKLLLQPLAENAISHGFKPADHHCHLKISGKKINEDVMIVIEDDGIGISEQALSKLKTAMDKGESSKGFGLVNVHQRIRLTYGDNYGLDIVSQPGHGTTVTVKIPAIEEEISCGKY